MFYNLIRVLLPHGRYSNVLLHVAPVGTRHHIPHSRWCKHVVNKKTVYAILILLITTHTFWIRGLSDNESVRTSEKSILGDEDEEEASRPPQEPSRNSRNTTNQTLMNPPEGYPWHRWDSQSIDPAVVVDMMDSVQACTTGNKTIDSGEVCRFYRYIVPYLVREGGVWISRSKHEYIEKNDPREIGRMQNFQANLQLALEIAKNAENKDKRIASLENGDLPIFLYKGDFNGCRGPAKVFFAWSKGQQCGCTFPVPSYFNWKSSKNNSTLWKETFQKWDKLYPWDKKLNSAIWRGGSTGSSRNSWQDLPRAQLVKKSMEHPDLIDAALVSASGRWSSFEAEMRNQSRFSKRMHQDDFMEHVAIIDIDGNSWSSRFAGLLCYNSVVIKVDPKDVDYFYEELEPWTHYLPVHGNLSNLEEVVEYAVGMENRDEIKSIVSNANQWCMQKLTYTQLATDLMWTMASYVDLMRKGENWESTWSAHKDAYVMPPLSMERMR